MTQPTRGIDTSINWTHIALFITTIFTVGVGYARLEAKVDRILLLDAKYDSLELRVNHIESVEQAQTFINKDQDDRFLRDEASWTQEQRPPKKTYSN